MTSVEFAPKGPNSKFSELLGYLVCSYSETVSLATPNVARPLESLGDARERVAGCPAAVSGAPGITEQYPKPMGQRAAGGAPGYRRFLLIVLMIFFKTRNKNAFETPDVLQ